jgi:hypothetical protein
MILPDFTNPGKLALTSLFVEGERDYLNLKSMCELCPDLQKLHLLETSVRDVAETKTLENGFTLSEIEKDFSKLNKVLI